MRKVVIGLWSLWRSRSRQAVRHPNAKWKQNRQKAATAYRPRYASTSSRIVRTGMSILGAVGWSE